MIITPFPVLALLPAAVCAANNPYFADGGRLNVDIVIVGGGASGAHSAVRLREDFNKSIVLIEKTDRLGGHVDTYVDSSTRETYGYGVQVYNDVFGAKEFFKRFGVDTITPARPAITSYADFKTGKSVGNSLAQASRVGAAEQRVALKEKYLALAEKYEDMLVPGFWNFPEPGQIPEELLLPFGELIKKYELEDAQPLIQRLSGGATGEELALTVVQEVNSVVARIYGGEGPSDFVPVGSNMVLYNNIAQLLAGDNYIL